MPTDSLGRRAPGTPVARSRRLLILLPLMPAAALLSSMYLPFVNSPHLWFGVPSLFVWTSAWVLLVTPALLAVEYLPGRSTGGDDE